MVNDVNTIVVVGRLTADMDLKYTGAGLPIGQFSVAVNRSKKSGDSYVDEVSYFEVKAFGKMAENLKPYLTKGKQVAVTGYLKQERWEKDGQKFSKITLGAEHIQLIGGNKQTQNEPADQGYGNDYGYGN